MSDPNLEQFLEALAQRLRMPLSPVKAAAEELRMTASDPNSQRAGEVILRQVGLLDEMLESLLDASRLERGRLPMTRSPVNLMSVLEAAVEQCRPALEAKSQRFTLDMTDQPLDVEGDEPRLVQIIRYVFDNAVKFTPPGGSIHLSISATDSLVEIRVRDNGCGMSAERIPQIFTPFGVDTTGSEDAGGLGLSLSIAKRLVELHKGAITAQSGGPGEGSEFCVTLPLHQD
jgi:signal transduction histidine kinase